ncbi:outer membrane protein assembly factor BamB family protein [Thermococcus barophilus]|uniref:Pyrrolo-quinoline quinone repeat domain-containing protein n=1 Tax=Thermococcus barophilus TaxID=55802 RepID=A0A0S1XC24_THEBA|nr:PQQ-binding-like beta-propeller repeat protein [Thermococcus barophilus]ALM75338.1 conserved membrane hypothetical protein [Thermococcus barophilus]
MKRATVWYLFLLALISGFTIAGDVNWVLWKGQICQDIQYQKSIESVAILGDRIYVGCSYRQIVNSNGMIGIYYLGETAAYFTNGTLLWQNSSGYVVKIVPFENGNVLVGNLGGFLTFDKDGRIISRNLTKNKLYDFTIYRDIIYAVDGDLFMEKGTVTYVGHLYSGKVENGKVALNGWILNFTQMPSRVRIGNSTIYIGFGVPSGYSGSHQFGAVYGISPSGKIKWEVNIGHWIRDMEIYNGKAIAGTGYGDFFGNIYMIDSSGNILWNVSLFYVEDVETTENGIYVGGINSRGGALASIDPASGKVLWQQEFPYRVKVVKYSNGILLVGTGKFETKQENSTSVVYSYGALYAVDPHTGRIIGELMDTGYIRSIAVYDNIAVIGTGSSSFYVIDISKIKAKTSLKITVIAVVAVIIILAVILRGKSKP